MTDTENRSGNGTTPSSDVTANGAGDPLVVVDTFEQVPVVLGALTGPEHRFDAANAAYRALMGGRDVLGTAVVDAFPELLGQQILGLCDEVYATGEPAHMREWRFQFSVGEPPQLQEAYLDVTLAPRRSADGTVTGISVWALDATERVQQRESARREAAAAERRYEAARDVIVALQEALLPADLPLLPGADIAARYLVASHDQAAGGDWFDAIPLPDGTVALVVGDVVGHGVAASAAMGQLRAVLATVLTNTGDLDQALAWVDAMAAAAPKADSSTAVALHGARSDVAGRSGRRTAMRAATVCVAVLDPATGGMRHASCGHPPPLVVGTDGATRYLGPTGGGPLGTGALPVPAEDHLRAGETLLLYSDGLVERPGSTISDGLDHLARYARDAVANRVMPIGAATSVAERVCHQVVELTTRAGYEDDVTALAVQLRTEPIAPLHLSLPATPAAVTATRDAIAEWLDAFQVDARERLAAEFAVGELVANTVEHAYARELGGAVRLDAVLLTDGTVQIRVADDGTWREPVHPAPVSSGRGLWLVAESVDAVRLDRGPDVGTTVTVSLSLHRPAVLATEPPAAHRWERPVSFGVDLVPAVDGVPAAMQVHGSVDITTADELADRIAVVGRGGVIPVSVDLAAVDILASAGVRVLFLARDQHAVHGSAFDVAATKGSLADQVLTLVGLEHRSA